MRRLVQRATLDLHFSSGIVDKMRIPHRPLHPVAVLFGADTDEGLRPQHSLAASIN
jgi:hypothetical protein